MNSDMKQYIDEQIDALTQVVAGQKEELAVVCYNVTDVKKTCDRTGGIYASRQYCRIRHTGDDRSTT